MENRQLNFDVARGGVQHRLSVCVGDTKSRTVTARFFSGSEPVPLTAAYLRGLRADGKQIYAACTVEDGAATYTFTTSDLSVGGTLMCEFDLHNGDAVMTSPRFAVLCGKPVYTGEGAEGSNEYAAYIAALLKLENLTVTAEAGDTAAATVTVGDTAVQLHFVLPKGEDGYTPERGVDYWTQEDKNAINNDLTDFVNSANVSIQYAVKTAAAAKAEANAATDAANAAIADLQAKADAGDFNGAKGDKGEKGDKGDKGDKGEQGAPGYTPVKGLDYWTPTEEAAMDAAKTAANDAADNASVAEAAASYAASMADEAASSASISAQNADAAAGEARAKAAELQAKADAGDFDGADGYTPMRGTDYWTDADKAAINADIAAQVAGKVDKIDGKGLSTNDYTDADKAAVAGLRTPFAHIGDIEITESGTKIAVQDNLALRMAVVLITVPDGSPALNVEFKFDDNNTATRYCSNLNSGRVSVELKNGIPWLDYSFIKGADTSSQTALGMPNNAFRAYATYAAKKITRMRIIGMNNAELLAGSKFEIYGVTV